MRTHHFTPETEQQAQQFKEAKDSAKTHANKIASAVKAIASVVF